MTTESNNRQYQIGVIIILFLSSFIVPFIFLYPIQELFYRPKEYYFFDPFFTAYIVLMVVLFMLAVMLLINFLVTPKTKKRKNIQRGIVGSSFVIASALIFLCINNYQYIDTKGIHMNHYFSLQEDYTSWEDIVKVEQTIVEKNGVSLPEKLIFTLQDGSIIEQSLTEKLSSAKQFINKEISNYGLTIENKYSGNE
ncbi:alkaline shock response membrane anchor protein AmaP [Lysinibacillus sp. CTST325]